MGKYKHRFSARVCVRLTLAQITAIQQLLPQQKKMAGKIRYLLSRGVSIARAKTELELASSPGPNEAHQVFWLRVSDDVHDFIKDRRPADGLDMAAEATFLAVLGLEQLQQAGAVSVPPATNEGTSTSRAEYLRQGLKLLWRALVGH